MQKFRFGQLTLEITCADNMALLNAVNKAKIRLYNVVYCSDLVLQVTISKNDFEALYTIAERQGATVKKVGLSGIYWTCKNILKRPVLLALITFLFAFFCYIPSRVLFVRVDGNSTIPTKQILEAAGECGISFGASRRQIRSEMMKNALLQKIPQLQWAGINTSGCTAIISVKEKTTQETQEKQNNQVCSIVASRDGVIQNCTVYQGNPLCTVGQAVKAGQTLVSGYLDCGIVIKATQANAEIEALTFRELQAIAPIATAARGALVEKKTNYSLQLGKKVINFYKDSGNLDANCGKIYSQTYLHLPGGFQLPVAIVKETLLFYEDKQEITTANEWEDWLAQFAKAHLQSIMVAGEIISAETKIVPTDDACHFYGKYACMEIIGQVRYEQTIAKGE